MIRTRILDFLYPPLCPLCGSKIFRADRTFPLCEDCEKEAAHLRIQGCCNPEASLPDIVALSCAYRYEGKLREAVLRYKFKGESWMAEPFAELLHRHLRECAGFEAPEAMTYVPVSNKRLAARGYDQTLEIVRKLQQKRGIPSVRSFSKKETAGDSAAGRKNRRERNETQKYVYTGRPSEIRDRSVLLIDDILTTGATLRECTRLLLDHGAGCVYAAVLASGRKDI